jgi:hypothetical protein
MFAYLNWMKNRPKGTKIVFIDPEAEYKALMKLKEGTKEGGRPILTR